MDNQLSRDIYHSIPINRPDIPDIEFDEYKKFNIKIEDFELRFSNWYNSSYPIIMTSSGKMALYLLFNILQLKGEVITSPLSCTMAFYPLLANAVKLKFVDIKPDTFNIDEEQVEKNITTDTSAIFVVHLGGFSPDMEKLRQIANKYQILLIEDCAQALGSHYKNKNVGTYGDFTVFSFAKNMWLAGGGAIYCQKEDFYDKLRKIQLIFPETTENLVRYRFVRDKLESERGFLERSDLQYYNQFFKPAGNANVGISLMNYFQKKDICTRPSDLQASILHYQLTDLDIKNKTRIKNAMYLIDSLKSKYNFQKCHLGQSVYSKLYLKSKRGISNKTIIPQLVNKGIDAKHLTKSHGIHFQERFDIHPDFSNLINQSELKNYMQLHDQVFAIPISSKMTHDEMDYIISTLLKI